jgi:hypothetical protein
MVLVLYEISKRLDRAPPFLRQVLRGANRCAFAWFDVPKFLLISGLLALLVGPEFFMKKTVSAGQFLSNDGRTSPFQCRMSFLTPVQRARRALKITMFFWFTAAVCILIPALHFVLTPGFAVAGIVAGSLALKVKNTLSDVHGTCPSCGAPIRFERLLLKGKLKEHCPSCRHGFEVQVLHSTRIT